MDTKPKKTTSQNPTFPPSFSLRHKVVLVTGATGLLGQGFCKTLIQQGAQVALVDLETQDCAQLEETLLQIAPESCRGFACDIRNPEAVESMVLEVASHFGGIDVLVNNAATKGSSLPKFLASFEDYDLKTWKEVMEVNVDGAFLVAQAVGKQMIRQGRGGSVIQTGSIYGIRAPDPRIYEGSEYQGHPISSPAVYSASKGAIVALSKYLATWWAPHQIRVNTLIPGGVQTGQNSAFSQRYASRVPLDRMAQPEDLHGALVFLASEASSYITGQELIVDGGLSAW